MKRLFLLLLCMVAAATKSTAQSDNQQSNNRIKQTTMSKFSKKTFVYQVQNIACEIKDKIVLI